jgi:hypothetical protein
VVTSGTRKCEFTAASHPRRAWKERGQDIHDHGFQALIAMWKALAVKGRYVQSLKARLLFWQISDTPLQADNVIYTALGWCIIDSGSVQSVDEVTEKILQPK